MDSATGKMEFSEEIYLTDYFINEIEENSAIIQHKIDGRLVRVPLSEVTDFFGLEEYSPQSPSPQEKEAKQNWPQDMHSPENRLSKHPALRQLPEPVQQQYPSKHRSSENKPQQQLAKQPKYLTQNLNSPKKHQHRPVQPQYPQKLPQQCSPVHQPQRQPKLSHQGTPTQPKYSLQHYTTENQPKELPELSELPHHSARPQYTQNRSPQHHSVNQPQYPENRSHIKKSSESTITKEKHLQNQLCMLQRNLEDWDCLPEQDELMDELKQLQAQFKNSGDPPQQQNMVQENLNVSEKVPERQAFKWDVNSTKCMLDLYAKFLNSVGPLKKFRNKKQMWAHIAIQINRKFKFDITGQQVETRYKCVGKRTKKDLNENKVSGAVFKVTEYGDEMRTIIELDDSLVPDTALSAGKADLKADLFSTSDFHSDAAETSMISTTQNEIPKVRRERKSAQALLYERFLNQKADLFERKEEKNMEKARDKKETKIKLNTKNSDEKWQRHNEKMEILRDILNRVPNNYNQ